MATLVESVARGGGVSQDWPAAGWIFFWFWHTKMSDFYRRKTYLGTLNLKNFAAARRQSFTPPNPVSPQVLSLDPIFAKSLVG